MNTKIKWLRDKINGLNMQGMIVSNPINVRYLTGIDAEGILLITRKENFYITDSRYIEEVNKILTIDDGIVVYNISNLCREDYENFFLFCENVGFEEKYVTYYMYKEHKQKYQINNFEETENLLEKQRMLKDEDEIEKIKTACKITDECFEYLKGYIKTGRTEKQIAIEIEKFFVENGADGLAFDTIVASGKNSSKPHAKPSDRIIQSGDILTIDMGCKYKGYCSDMTRTIFVGYVPENMKNVYDLVLKNQIQVLEELKEGSNIRSISKNVEYSLKLNGYTLLHSLGHGVGLEVHEIPYINPKHDYNLRENMVIAIEPGVYIPDSFGVRIEDTVLITKNGCEILTKSDKNYVIVDKEV